MVVFHVVKSGMFTAPYEQQIYSQYILYGLYMPDSCPSLRELYDGVICKQQLTELPALHITTYNTQTNT